MSRSSNARTAIATVLLAATVAACASAGAARSTPISTLPGVTAASPATTMPSETSTPTTETTTTDPAITAAPVVTEVTPSEVWPTTEWETVDAEDAGLDPVALAAMSAQAEAAGSDCLVVTHDGRIVDEWYWKGTDERSEREAFSVTKSISSTLVGIAVDQGLLELDQKASDFIEEWVGTPSEDVTVRNLVSNDSGRFQDFQTDYVAMAGQAEDKTAFSIALEQQHEIGTVWIYNNAAIQTLEAVLEEATGMPVGEFASEVLFEPLGMETTISTDQAGNTLTFMGAQASCRDLARFGLLFLRGGEWNGEQIVSRDWVEEATSPSTELNSAYGFLWWINRDGIVADGEGGAGRQGRMIPDAPEDMYAALGLFEQIVAVLPSDELVVTRMGDGEGPDGSTFNLATLASAIEAARLG